MSNSMCVEKEFLEKYLGQLNELLVEAYYSTPPHIASKSLIKRARDLVQSFLSMLS